MSYGHMQARCSRPLIWLVLAASPSLCAADDSSSAALVADNYAPPAGLPQVTVVGSTPLTVRIWIATKSRSPPGSWGRRHQSHRDSESDQAILSNVPAVTVNDTEGNVFQPDILFRGFTASPVAGTPEGLAIFVNGARFNDAFGDTVNWDLIAPAAISRRILRRPTRCSD